MQPVKRTETLPVTHEAEVLVAGRCVGAGAAFRPRSLV